MQDNAKMNMIFKPMSKRTFLRFSVFIQEHLGIKMPETKKTMLQARLQKRLRFLGLNTYDEYYDYVFSPEGRREELSNMIDVVTTNKTDFFREPKHFDYLIQNVLPAIINHKGGIWRGRLRIWSAGCSTGEEPYTIAMVLHEFKEKNLGVAFNIHATDISMEVLHKAQLGIYSHERIEPIPYPLRKKYLLKSKDKNKDLVRIAPQIRNSVNFYRCNLLEQDVCIQEKMDVIFFRNVLIYFDRSTQQKVLDSLCRQLVADGFLFVGHSETLNGLSLPLTPVSTSVYKKIG